MHDDGKQWNASCRHYLRRCVNCLSLARHDDHEPGKIPLTPSRSGDCSVGFADATIHVDIGLFDPLLVLIRVLPVAC